MKRILIAIAVLWAGPSLAANKLYISEYAAIGIASGLVAQIANEPDVLDQTPVDFSGGAANSATFNVSSQYVRFMCDSRCSIKVRPKCTGAVATTSNKPLGIDQPEYFGISPGDCVSVIANP